MSSLTWNMSSSQEASGTAKHHERRGPGRAQLYAAEEQNAMTFGAEFVTASYFRPGTRGRMKAAVESTQRMAIGECLRRLDDAASDASGGIRSHIASSPSSGSSLLAELEALGLA